MLVLTKTLLPVIAALLYLATVFPYPKLEHVARQRYVCHFWVCRSVCKALLNSRMEVL